MLNYLKEIYIAIKIILVFTILTGIIYPLVITVLAQVIFKDKAQGSLIIREGKIIGSSLIGQSFSGEEYFYSRPSAAGNGYDAVSSGATNWGPTNKLLTERVNSLKESLQKGNSNQSVPIDLVTASASGLDPHISPAAASFQIARVAKVRKISEEDLKKLVSQYTEGRQLGILGEFRVNVLKLNLALDSAYPVKNTSL